MEYEIVDWVTVNDLRREPGAEFVSVIEDTFAKVYKLEDSSFVIMPLSPFAKCLMTKDKRLVDKWILENYYPTDEESNKFYFVNKHKIDNLNQFKWQLKDELYRYLYKDENFRPPVMSAEEIDRICKLLKKQRRFKEFKLHFIVLAGEYLIEQNAGKKWQWGVVLLKQLLNPIVMLVLLNDNNEYFELEYSIDGKWGYIGMRAIEHSATQFWRKPDEFAVIRNV